MPRHVPGQEPPAVPRAVRRGHLPAHPGAPSHPAPPEGRVRRAQGGRQGGRVPGAGAGAGELGRAQGGAGTGKAQERRCLTGQGLRPEVLKRHPANKLNNRRKLLRQTTEILEIEQRP